MRKKISRIFRVFQKKAARVRKKPHHSHQNDLENAPIAGVVCHYLSGDSVLHKVSREQSRSHERLYLCLIRALMRFGVDVFTKTKVCMLNVN